MGFLKRDREERARIDITKTTQEEMENRIARKVVDMLAEEAFLDNAYFLEVVETTAQKAAAETAEALKKAALLRRRDDWAYSRMNRRLYAHYTNGENDEEIAIALDARKGDDYLYLIPMRYKRRMPFDAIEKEIHIPASVIARETKRIVLELFDALTEGGK